MLYTFTTRTNIINVTHGAPSDKYAQTNMSAARHKQFTNVTAPRDTIQLIRYLMNLNDSRRGHSWLPRGGASRPAAALPPQIATALLHGYRRSHVG